MSPARRRFLAVVGALLLCLVAGGLYAVLSRPRTQPVPQDEPGPVLLISGYGGNVGALGPMAVQLQVEGRRVLAVPAVEDGTGDLRAQAKALQDVVVSVLRDSKAPSVDVIGYSAGGVVARLWVKEYGGASLARRVLTIGAPQHGTSIAALGAAIGGCPVACQQLAPDSDLMRRLDGGDETPRGPEFISIWSTSDEVVTPPDSAHLEGALDFTIQSVCPKRETLHRGLTYDPVVLAALRSVLGAGPPVVPRHVIC